MDPRTLLGLSLIALVVVLVILLEIRLAIRRRRLRRQHAQQPTIHAVGSPEYNAQVVDMIRQLNERLAKDGKRVPERVAIDIITQVTDQYGKPEN